jgi:hypothetical protein
MRLTREERNLLTKEERRAVRRLYGGKSPQSGLGTFGLAVVGTIVAFVFWFVAFLAIWVIRGEPPF